MQVVEFVASSVEGMETKTIQTVQRFNAVTGFPGLSLPAPTKDPLKESATAPRDDLVNVMTEVAPAVGASYAKESPLEAVNTGPEAKAKGPKAREVA